MKKYRKCPALQFFERAPTSGERSVGIFLTLGTNGLNGLIAVAHAEISGAASQGSQH